MAGPSGASGPSGLVDRTRPPRPLLLLPRPEPIWVVAEVPEGPPRHFRWRRAFYRVACAEGPERIAPEWWRARDAGAATRDYYRVEDSTGRRFWLFRAGLYERSGALGGGDMLSGAGERTWLDGNTAGGATEDRAGDMAGGAAEAHAAGPRWFLHGLFA
nr:hypothetical protein [Rhodothalassium salexigens]